jgi:hypothetical protein
LADPGEDDGVASRSFGSISVLVSGIPPRRAVVSPLHGPAGDFRRGAGSRMAGLAEASRLYRFPGLPAAGSDAAFSDTIFEAGMARAAAVTLLAILLAVPGEAAPASCGPHDVVVDYLARTFQEMPAGAGTANSGGRVELFTAPKGRSWTLLYTGPDAE